MESATKDLGQERVKEDKEQSTLLKHAHIKYKRARSGWGEKVAEECERTLTDRWSQHAVSFD